MNFLFPGFLWALFALSVPIIIHLFNFRKYKKVYFTNVRFLKELKQESESRSKLKQYLILISRLLALTALVFAFTQPYLPGSDTAKITGQKAMSVYIDNSFSMEAVSKNGYLLDVAKAKAREIVKSFSATDKFQVVTNDFEGKHQRLVNRDEFLQMLDEIKVSPTHRKIHEVFMRQKDLLSQSGCSFQRSYLLSDFQRSFIDEKQLTADSQMVCSLIPLLEKNNSGNNVFIDSCWFENPVQQYGSIQKLHVKITNKSSTDLENAALRLIINGKIIAPSSFAARSNESKEVVLTFSIKDFGILNARLEIDDHPVTYDDKLFFSFSVERRIPVLLINGEGSNSAVSLQTLLNSDSLFSVTEMKESAIDFNSFSKYNLIIFNDINKISSGSQQEIKKYLTGGGSFAVFPATSADVTSYNELFGQLGVNFFGNIDTSDQRCERINFDQGFYSDVFEKKSDNMDLPRVFNHFNSSKGIANTEESIIRLLNGNPFLSYYSFGRGKIYVCNVSLDERWTNFSRHALFVPSIYKMAINSQVPRQLYYTTGENTAIEVKNNSSSKESNFNVRSEDGKINFIPETRISENKILLFLQQMVQSSGNYFLEFDKEKLFGLGFNYPRAESVLEYYSVSELRDLLGKKNLKTFTVADSGAKSVQAALQEINGGTKLWKVFLILALLFFAIEIALNRLMK